MIVVSIYRCKNKRSEDGWKSPNKGPVYITQITPLINLADLHVSFENYRGLKFRTKQKWNV